MQPDPSAAAVKLAEAQLNEVKVSPERTSVRAPLTGTVVEDYVEQNDDIEQGTNKSRISPKDRKPVDSY